jgi:hypothetical protein
MFAQLNETDDFKRLELVGVTADGREIPLSDDSYSAPMTAADTELAFFKASLLTNPAKRHEALKRLGADFWRRYERRQRNGEIAGPPLAGLRVYARRWDHVDRWAGNIDTPDAVEVLFDTGSLLPPDATPAPTLSKKLGSSRSAKDAHR